MENSLIKRLNPVSIFLYRGLWKATIAKKNRSIELKEPYVPENNVNNRVTKHYS